MARPLLCQIQSGVSARAFAAANNSKKHEIFRMPGNFMGDFRDVFKGAVIQHRFERLARARSFWGNGMDPCTKSRNDSCDRSNLQDTKLEQRSFHENSD